MKFYISGKRDEQERYSEAAEKLQQEGHEVINYMELTRQLPGMSSREHETMQHMLIKMADAIFVLNNWQESDPARAEVFFALENSVNIMFEQIETVEELPFP